MPSEEQEGEQEEEEETAVEGDLGRRLVAVRCESAVSGGWGTRASVRERERVTAEETE